MFAVAAALRRHIQNSTPPLKTLMGWPDGLEWFDGWVHGWVGHPKQNRRRRKRPCNKFQAGDQWDAKVPACGANNMGGEKWVPAPTTRNKFLSLPPWPSLPSSAALTPQYPPVGASHGSRAAAGEGPDAGRRGSPGSWAIGRNPGNMFLGVRSSGFT